MEETERTASADTVEKQPPLAFQIVSLVTGLWSLLGPVFTLSAAVVAIVFGFLSRNPATKKLNGMAVAGIVCGCCRFGLLVIGMLISFLETIVCLVAAVLLVLVLVALAVFFTMIL